MIIFTGHILTQDKEEKERYENMGVDMTAPTEVEEVHFDPKDISVVIGNVTKVDGEFYPITDVYFKSGLHFPLAASKKEVLHAWKNATSDYKFNCTVPE